MVNRKERRLVRKEAIEGKIIIETKRRVCVGSGGTVVLMRVEGYAFPCDSFLLLCDRYRLIFDNNVSFSVTAIYWYPAEHSG